MKIKNINYIIKILVVVILTNILLSCQNNTRIQFLNLAESIMEEYPDSALKILEKLNYNHLNSERERALYGLLYARARDKNRMILPPDTLIEASTDYFKMKGDRRHYMISEFCLGRAFYETSNYPRAILSFYKVKETAEEDSAFFWAGMACRSISEIYELTHNIADMKVYCEKELEYFKISGKRIYTDFAVVDLARALCYSAQYDESNRLLQNLLQDRNATNSTSLCSNIYRVLSTNYTNQAKYTDALVILNKLINSPNANTEDSLRYAFNLMSNHQNYEALKFLNQVSEKNNYIATLTRLHLNAEKGEYQQAFNDYHQLYLYRDTLQQPADVSDISYVLDDYFKYRINSTNSEKQKNELIHCLLTIIIIIISFSIISIIIQKNNKLKNILSEKSTILNSVLKSFNLMKRSKPTSNYITDRSGLLYIILEKIGVEVYSCADKNKAIKKIINDIDTYINKYINGSELFIDLKNNLNKKHSGIITSLQADIPNLKEIDINLFILTMLNFSGPAISVYLRAKDVESIYGRKKRLKEKIKRLPEEKRNMYLRFFN